MADAEAEYLAALTARVREVLGDDLAGVYAGGSWALGDYDPGRSDLDVALVCASSLSDATIDALVAALRHEALPCPARGLELVAYTRASAGAGGADPAFEVNLNSGARLTSRVERHGHTPDGHWFAIDRAVLAAHGIALAGPAAAGVFRAPARSALIDLLTESLRWHAGSDAARDDAVLNACRAVRFARDGEWRSKPRAGRWWLASGLSHEALVEAALAARTGGAPLDAGSVRRFLADAEQAVASA